jgi:hypothetical protein
MIQGGFSVPLEPYLKPKAIDKSLTMNYKALKGKFQEFSSLKLDNITHTAMSKGHTTVSSRKN